MKIKPSIGAYLALAASSLLLLISCDKKSEDVLPKGAKTEVAAQGDGPVVELSFESVVSNNLRGLTFDQTNPRTPKVDPDGINVLCIVRSDNPNDEPVYRVIKWERDATIVNRIRLKKHRFQFPSGYATAAGKKWYIMGIIGGTWNEGTKKVSISTEDIKTLDKDTAIDLNVPAVSKWVEIPTNGNGEFIFQDGNTTVTYSQMPFHSQGALIQHKIGGNTSAYQKTLQVSSFTVVSTAFSFEGHYDLSKANLPPLNNSTAGHKHGGMLKWVASGESGTKEYAATNAGIAEYEHEFQLPTSIQPGAQGTPDVMTFWVMPTGQTVGKARTNVFVKASAEAGAPKMLRLPGYGKNHDKVLQTGDFAKITSVLHRPKLAIEYMAEYNVRRQEMADGTFWGDVGTEKPTKLSNRFASSHGRESVSALFYNEAEATSIPGYHLPTIEEWAGVFPTGNTDGLRFKPSGVTSPTTFPKKTIVATVAGKTNSYGFQLRQTPSVNGRKGFGTAYVLHFIDDANGNKMRVAYRYRLVPNEEYQSVIGKTLDGKILGGKNKPHNVYIHEEDSATGEPVQKPTIIDYWASNLQVDAIYLGSYFLGTVEDISSEAWWKHPNRRIDIISRTISSNTSEWIGYEYYRGAYTINGVEKVSYLAHRYSPHLYNYWLSGAAGQSPQLSKYDTAVQAAVECRPIFLFSTDHGGSSTSYRPAVAGAFVRLFSDK